LELNVKALQVSRNGRPSDALEIVEIDAPKPGPSQVRIRVNAGSLNFNDLDRCYGRVTTIPMPPPFILGMDVCGIVDEAGEGGEHWVGQRVVAITQMAQGGLAEYALAPLDSVFAAPTELDDAEAAAFVIPYHTAHLALFERGALNAGEGLLVISGASGLGTAAIQLGVAAGARVFATAGGPDKVALCGDLGAELVVDHREVNFADAVLDHTDDVGAEVVCDLAGGTFVADAWRCTAREGRYLAVGFADDPENGTGGIALRPTCIGNFSIVGVIGAYMSHVPGVIRRSGFNPYGRDTADAVHASLLEGISAGQLRPVVGKRTTLEGAAEALEAHEARKSLGRSVVEIAS
jgi:NADPH2:quinone reductase